MAKTKKKKKRVQIKGVIDGSMLGNKTVAKQIPFALFLSLWALIYITIRYHAETQVRRVNRLEKELKEMRAEAISTASELMYMSKQSVVFDEVKTRKLDLIEPKDPPIKLVVTEEDEEFLEDLKK